MKTNQIISKNVQILRHKLRLTQKQLAEKVGLSRPTITLIEQGKRKLSVEDMTKFCKVLECKYEDLLPVVKSGKSSNSSSQKNNIKELYDSYKTKYKRNDNQAKIPNNPLDDYLSDANPYYSPNTNYQIKYDQ